MGTDLCNCFRGPSECLPCRFRVKRPPSSWPLPRYHCVANAILAYGTLTRTLRTASAQIPRIFPMFSDRGDDHDDDDEGNLPTAFRQPSANLPSQARMLTAHITMLPRSFRKPSEQSRSSKTTLKNSLRRSSAHFRVKRLLPLHVSLALSLSRSLPGDTAAAGKQMEK